MTVLTLLTTLSMLIGAAAMGTPQDPTTTDDPVVERSAGPISALRHGTFNVGLRYRVESVDDESLSPSTGLKLDPVLASTLRTAIRYDSDSWRSFSVHLAVEDVTVVGGETYNNAGAGSAANNRLDRAIVADPDNTEVSQAFLRIEPSDRLTLSIGRQEIAFGEQRFVGTVGWRQNHQEFDAIRFELKPHDRFSIDLAFLDRVHTVTGANIDTASSLLRAEWEFEALVLTAYGYWLDYERTAQRRLSSATAGVRVGGTLDLAFPLSWSAEFARQTDNANHPDDFELDYSHLTLAGSFDRAGRPKVSLGVERMEGDGANAFRTPLATLHKFNGFADRFLVTPPSGLEDRYASVGQTWSGWSWHLTHHRFSADTSSAAYGSEWDAVVTYSPNATLTFAFKGAAYNADGFATDTTKLAVWLSWSL